MKLPYKNKIPVAAHRGNSKYFPENTMAAFRSAASLEPDMIETDVHMTADGELVLIHDHNVDRTTDGTGPVYEKTLAEIKALDAGLWKGEEFRGEQIPTLKEFLDFFADYPDMLFNIELKDYPARSPEFAFASADKTIAMLKEYSVLEKCVINTWSGELNEYLVEKYGDEVKIHAYSPLELMGPKQKRNAFDYAYCICLWGDAMQPVNRYALSKKCGVEPWVYYKIEDPALYDAAIENGAMLFTANDPAWAMDYLRKKGLHK